ncbi:MAG: hypothetical protein H7251_16105 [Acetobacteraceae bacterium]|nr:hypothetical protein [Acetobacteraceae bacterium]
MFNFSVILTDLRAAIAVVAARDPTITALLVMVWGRISRMGARLERLMAKWRAGTLPTPRKPRASGVAAVSPSAERPAYPTAPAWLIAYVRAAASYGSQLEHMMGEDEFARFLAEVPQARRILRPLCRMLGVGVVATKVGKPRRVWTTPDTRPMPAPAGLVLGPGGCLIYV